MQTIAHCEGGGNLPLLDPARFSPHDAHVHVESACVQAIEEAIISQSGGKSRLYAAYDLYQYFDEKTDALTKWGDWVEAITGDRERYLYPVTA